MVSECSSSEGRLSRQSGLSKERFLELRRIVEKAAQGRKTFTVFGKYTTIREALKARGWIQNFDLQKLTLPKQRQTHEDARLESRDDDERLVVARLLRHVPVSFVWATTEPIDWNVLAKTTIISRFPRVYFTTKVGIAGYLEESHWFVAPGVTAPFPRCYVLSNPEDYNIFVTDFRMTACLGLLNTLILAIDKQKTKIFVQDGKVPLRVVEFAVRRLSEYVSSREHEDIDRDTERIWDHQWDQFLTHYYQFVHDGHPFQPASDHQIQEMYSCAKMTVESIRGHWPQMEMDGTHNVWIVKPGAKSRGRGIQVLNRLEQIQNRLGISSPNEPRFVVQKYIEKPLLIYSTKFDIRQWFLVTSIYPLTIWMYKECYLRFCSHLFSLRNMHESVHLSNNAIQCKYKNEKQRDRLLPDENMWDSLTFQAYLRSLGKGDRWDKVIYPGMRGAITCALLAAQEHVVARPNTFELYGADFMLTEDLQPWLIEINSSPCMSPTTSVTARLCPQCLEDIIKVVIDRRGNKEAKTGLFELAYRQEISSAQPYTGMNLTVRGTRLRTGGPRMGAGGSKGAEPQKETPMREAIHRLSQQLSSSSASSTSTGTLSPVSENRSGRREPERGRRVKRHCCTGRASLSQAVHRYKISKNAEVVTKRINQSGGELYEWRKRVERTRLDCKTTLMNFGEAAKSAGGDRSKSPLPEIRKSREVNNNTSHLNFNMAAKPPPPHKTANSLLQSINVA